MHFRRYFQKTLQRAHLDLITEVNLWYACSLEEDYRNYSKNGDDDDKDHGCATRAFIPRKQGMGMGIVNQGYLDLFFICHMMWA